MQIRKGDFSDIVQIANFQVEMALETEDFQLSPVECRKGVQKIFDEPSLGFYLVAEEGDELIACLLIQNEWSDWRNRMVWWIHSVYVHPDFRQQGIFRLMYRHLAAIVTESESLGGLRLFVDKRNIRAQEVYRKMGMNDEHYILFEWMPQG
ncbi:MAG: GNAT family N-acetyltransferase [Bacteroidales bacterium]|nr:GNAT family N-acetyltransferase [Bacteroidales bacterium]